MTANRHNRFRRAGASVALVAIFATVTINGSISPAAAGNVLPNPTGVIVTLLPGQSIDAINNRHRTFSVDAIPALSSHLVTWSDIRTPDQVVAELASDTAVEFANPNLTTRAPEVAFSGRIYKWSTAATGAETTQWAADAIGLAKAHRTSTGAGMTVAIIDTGIDATNPAFAGLIEPGIDFVDGDMTPGDDQNAIDENFNGVVDEAAGHGTHVAGIVHMVAPAAHILPVRVLDSDGNSDTFTVAQAMLWAGDNGADVVNVSLGQSGSSTLLRKASDLLWGRGIVVVGAAGNEARSRASFPAASKCAISVTATNQLGGLADFASYGSSVDVAAPGEGIVSAFPFSTTGLATWSGTSMAAPMVAGEVAVLRSQRPDLGIGAIARLVASAGVELVAGSVGVANLRRIDVAGAVERAAGVVVDTDECLQ